MALTDTWLKTNNGREREDTLTKADSEGLSVRVSPKGKITFQLRYRYAGKQCRLDLGTYPLTTLKQARQEAERMRGILEQGRDPRVHKKIERQKIQDEMTLEGLYRTWHEKYAVDNKKNADQILRSFELYVFPKLGDLPADQISIHEWLDLLERHAKKSQSIAERILHNTKQCLSWGIKRQLIDKNPLSMISAKNDLNIKKRSTDRVLTDQEICMVWNFANESRMSQKNVYFVWLVMFFGCRAGELRLARKDHFDLVNNVWTIPPENHKTGGSSGKPLIRPIIDDIKPILLDVMALNNTEYMFTNSDDVEQMGRSAPLSLPYNIMQYARRARKVEIEHFSIHDLRRTARTNFSKLTKPYIAEIMLGHALPKIQGTYDHYDYLEEQKEAYQSWWEQLQQIVSDASLLDKSHLGN